MSKYAEIKGKYRGEFIAIFDEEIIGNTNHQSLLEKIQEKRQRYRFCVSDISKTDDILIT